MVLSDITDCPSSDAKREKKREDDHFQLAQHSVDFRLASQTGKVGSIAFSIRAKLANKVITV